MQLQLVSASTDLAIAVSAVADDLFITDDDQLDKLTRKVKAAIDYCERQIPGHRPFVKKQYRMILEEFPADELEIPMPPLLGSSTITITYYDTNNASQTLSSTTWDAVVPTEAPATLKPKLDETWPSTYSRPDAVTVQFTAGWASADKVPALLKEAVSMKTEHLLDPERFGRTDVDRIVDRMLDTYDHGAYG
jgi:hypothetical protein